MNRFPSRGGFFGKKQLAYQAAFPRIMEKINERRLRKVFFMNRLFFFFFAGKASWELKQQRKGGLA